MTVSKPTKIKIYRIVSKEFERIQRSDEQRAIAILEDVWDLKTLPSEDERYNTALEDVIQHYFRNDDWTTDYLLQERLDIYGEGAFQKFIESILAPINFQGIEHLAKISDEIDQLLLKENLKLVTIDYDQFGHPIQKIQTRTDENDLPPGIKKNDIPFYVLKEDSLNISEKEYYELVPYTSWNDYGIISIFSFYHNSPDRGRFFVGNFKIIHDFENVTYKHLENRFYHLSEYFCSSASTSEYYLSLQSYFGESRMIGILYALRDAAYFPDICDEWYNKPNFQQSLIRDNGAERLLRDLKPVLKGYDLSSLFNFSYRFRPAYSETDVKIDFDFNSLEPLPDRIIGIIGKNGTGKTQLMNRLPNSLSQNKQSDFYDKIPSFTKIIAVSYSVFDTFSIPKKNATFNYVYCGLKDDEGDVRSTKGLTISFHNNWKKIDNIRRTKRWRAILYNVIDREIVDQFIVASKDSSRDLEVSMQGFHEIRNKLSSGQSILLYILTQVVANIRVDSLILYDEPETHLHPNAIVELMNSIYELVNEFESFCLITTHSPLVIRELFSKNVYVMKRDSNVPSLRRIGIESFGENLGVLSDEVFGDREVPKQYKKIIQELIDKGYEFEQIVNLLESEEVPLSLNARIFITNLLTQRNEKR